MKQFTPKGWNPELWKQVEHTAEHMTREELLAFYKETDAMRADNFDIWTKEDLMDVLDEITEEKAHMLIEWVKRNNR